MGTNIKWRRKKLVIGGQEGQGQRAPQGSSPVVAVFAFLFRSVRLFGCLVLLGCSRTLSARVHIACLIRLVRPGW